VIRWRELEIAPDGSTRKVLRYERLGEIPRKDAAEKLAQKLAVAGESGAKRSLVEFRAVANDWQAHVVPMYKHSTQKNHRHILAKHLLPRFGDSAMCEVTRQSIQEYVTHLMRRGYAPKTIDHIHDVLSAVLRTAVKWGHLPENPAHDVDLPRLRTVRPKWALTTSQAGALLNALPPLARTMVGFALVTGLRRGELFALRWKDVSDQGQVLTVREAVYEGVFGTPKTDAGCRRIPLSQTARLLLDTWKTCAKRTDPDALMFATWSGKPIAPNNVLRRWVFPACGQLQMPRATWLTFRRTYSSWAHDKGVPGKIVAELMGHAKVDTTLNVYTQVLDASVRTAVAKVGDELFTIVHKPAEAAELTR
jgi:integrase